MNVAARLGMPYPVDVRVLWIAGLLAACAEAPNAPPVLANHVAPTPPPPECLIAGGIFDSATGEPLAGATIFASNGPGHVAITDEKGLFSLRGTGAPGKVEVYYADVYVAKQVTCERNLVVRLNLQPQGPIVIW